MPQMLLAADERLEKSLVAPLQAKGWSVKVVRFLSEIPEACESEPLPEVVAATFPAALGAHHALAELTRMHGSRMPPIVAILPESRREEEATLSAAGAAAVFAGPVRLGAFHEKTSALAAVVRAERERIAAEARRREEEARRLAERNSMPPTQVIEEVEETAITESTQSRKWIVWAIVAAVVLALLLGLAMNARALFGVNTQQLPDNDMRMNKAERARWQQGLVPKK